MNSKAIADAIATRFVGITANGQGLAVGPTASLPNAIAKGPALLVFPPTGVLEIGAMKQRNDEYDFAVRLLNDPLNYPERTDALYAWFDAMRDRVEGQLRLGLDYVLRAEAIRSRCLLDVDDWYGTQFDMVELVVRVKLFEIVTGVAQ